MIKRPFRNVGVLVLVGMLLSTYPVSAATSLGVDTNGDLTPSRISANLTISVVCDAGASGQTNNANLSVKIFQSVGRLLNIGTGSATLTCDGAQADINVTVNAIPGLKFQPGPATVLVSLTEQSVDQVTGLPTGAAATTEIGGRVNLHP